MGKKKMTLAQRTKGLKKKENCPVTGKLLHLTVDAVGRLQYRGGPYTKGGRKFTSVIYIS